MTKQALRNTQQNTSATMPQGQTIQQNSMRNASQKESETDVLMMDDVQFTASLDRLLDSELVNSAYNNNTGQPQGVVSTDPSVASSKSSTSVARASHTQQQQQQQAQTTTLPPPPPQRPSKHPGAPATIPTASLLPPPPKNPQVIMGPSALTQRLAFTMPTMTVAPPVMQSMSSNMSTTTSSSRGTKRGRDPSSFPISEDESERERRRQDRNAREQQRSRRITEQISLLRDVLVEAGVPCKPDKNSTLISVAEYIQQLQNRSNLLDGEHKKLLDTIARTNEMVNNQYYQATADGTTSSSSTVATTPTVSHDLLSDANVNSNGPLEDENNVFVQGLDYKSVFQRCGIALAVASIDGRFIDCNSEFVTLSGYSRKELLPGEELSKTEVQSDVVPLATPSTASLDPPPRNLSLFNLLNREDMENVFSAMSSMLRRPVVRRGDADASADLTSVQLDCWSGSVRQNREGNESELRMNISLVRTPGGRPKFFNCTLTD